MQHFVENLLKVLKVLKKANKGGPASETEKLRHALRTAHRAYRMTLNKKFQKTLDKSKSCGIVQIEKEE